MKIDDFMAAKKYVELLEQVQERQDALCRLTGSMCSKAYLTFASGGFSVKLTLEGDDRFITAEEIGDYLRKRKERIEKALADI